ncbi:prolyl oligopeptidase family serine peptidase [Labilibaculum sp.]|uniref:S9 family peptidase n=1 Tax=Labilibaculum sp. TaxID=2060723 RepID=UPI0035678B49
MKKSISLLSLIMIFTLGTKAAQKTDGNKLSVSDWLFCGPINTHLPAFTKQENLDGNTYELKDFLQENQVDPKKIQPIEKDTFLWPDQQINWKKTTVNSKGFTSLSLPENSLSYFVSYLSCKQWSKVKFAFKSYSMAEVYVDGVKLITQDQAELKDAKELSEEIKLEQGKHCILVKFLSGKEKNGFQLSLLANEKMPTDQYSLSLSPTQNISISKILDGTKVNNTQLSPDEKFVLISYSRTLPPSNKNEKWQEIQEIASGKITHSFRGSKLSNLQWVPVGNQLSYTKNYEDKTSIFVFDIKDGSEKEIAEGIENFDSYSWSPTGKKIIYSVQKDHSEKWEIRKIQGMEDRLPGFRTRSFLYQLDVENGVRQRLTYGSISTKLHDISKDGKYILFSQSRPDYKEYPYDKQDLYQMNLENFQLDTIWKDKLFAGYAQYSADGSKLLIQAGPSCFGKIGENIGKQPIANNYDGQLYILDLSTQKVDPITYHFDPSVDQAVWNKKDGNIYLKAEVKDYVRLFQYKIETKEFSPLAINSDVVRNFNLSAGGEKITYTACSISTPYQAFVYNISKRENLLISNPQKENLKNVQFGKTEDWNFTKEDGKTIIGRIYYPPNFDASKKYPVIVNYYAGTVPVERSYGGRYPLNLYAAMGYVVYLLQPSGATGFGQEFSAEHQNNWGISTADEIIEGTTKFLKAHPFTDADHVGCIGASYGGFMTMLLQTRTDIFAAAISHAGISDISSYWGEGYWGYSYSVNASAKSFPWNNRHLYVDQSPLFNADKVVTPMLLIHGSVDTNVPLGESIQMYQALKLLGKDVDFVLVKDQDHHITNYSQRILWNNTIFAYFAKHLKKQDAWWNELYPDKNL